MNHIGSYSYETSHLGLIFTYEKENVAVQHHGAHMQSSALMIVMEALLFDICSVPPHSEWFQDHCNSALPQMTNQWL
jgi:hypothetical protein